MTLALPDVLLLSAALCALLGLALLRGHTALLVGYAPDRVTDERELARFAGRGVLALASAIVLLGMQWVDGPPESLSIAASVVMVLLVCAWLVAGVRRFEN